MDQSPTRTQILTSLSQALPGLRREFGVQRLALYGSFARGEATPASDVDILVQLERPLGQRLALLAARLERILGRKVDLSTFESLHRKREDPALASLAAEIESTLTYVE